MSTSIAKRGGQNIISVANKWRAEALTRLQEANDLATAKEVREEALAMQAALKAATKHRMDAVALQNNAGMVRVEAEAAIGAMTLALRNARGVSPGGRPSKTPRHDSEFSVPTARELGLSDQERRRYEDVAKAKESGALEEYIKRCEEEDEPISTRGAIKAAKGGPTAHVGQNSGEYEWGTPIEIIEDARYVLGGVIYVDPASSEFFQQFVQARTFYTAERSGLAVKRWDGAIFGNPPYSHPLIDDFCSKLVAQVNAGHTTRAVWVTNNATETVWGQLLLDNAAATCFPKRRIAFLDRDGRPRNQPLQGQMINYFGDAGGEGRFRERFAKWGVVR